MMLVIQEAYAIHLLMFLSQQMAPMASLDGA